MVFKARNGGRVLAVTSGAESVVTKHLRLTKCPVHGMAEGRSAAAGFVAAFADRPSARKLRAASFPIFHASPEGIEAMVREWVAPTPEEMSFHIHPLTSRLFLLSASLVIMYLPFVPASNILMVSRIYFMDIDREGTDSKATERPRGDREATLTS